MSFLITPTYEWQFAPQVEDADFTKIAKKAGLGPEVARLLFERGIQDQESLKKFLEPSLEDLHDPYLLHDMDKAVERIRQAIEEGENILVYGDYDADGMTSASNIIALADAHCFEGYVQSQRTVGKGDGVLSADKSSKFFFKFATFRTCPVVDFVGQQDFGNGIGFFLSKAWPWGE